MAGAGRAAMEEVDNIVILSLRHIGLCVAAESRMTIVESRMTKVESRKSKVESRMTNDESRMTNDE